MIVDLGKFVFFLIGPILLLQLVSAAQGVRVGRGPAQTLSRVTSLTLAPAFLVVLVSLSWALLTNDFDLAFVAHNTSYTTPLLYKIVGVWGNHEGSLILWLLVLSIFLALLVRRPAGMPERTQTFALLFLGILIAGFYGFSAFLSSPFLGNGDTIPGSGDLNPLLQDVGQSIHPPMLYLGYTASGAVFAIALAVLADQQLAAKWADWMRPYALLCWSFLTAGIALGSWWAYYELGWGGWWFWDPVENLALMPWLLATALIHSLQVMRRRGQLSGWSLLLALLIFLMVLLGTFIVRSGLLTSVHAFAADPTRGLYLLVFLGVAATLSLGAFVVGTRGKLPEPMAMAANREGALLLNNLLIMTLFTAVLAGTLAPTAIDLLGGETYVVQEAFYVPTFVWPALGLLALMALGVWTQWRREGLAAPWILGGSLLLLLIGFLVLSLVTSLPLNAALIFALALWLLVASLGAWVRQVGRLSNLGTIPVGQHGWALAHVGLSIAALGMTAAALIKVERFYELDGRMENLFPGHVTLGERVWVPGENHWSLATPVQLRDGRRRPAETRLYHPRAHQLNPIANVADRQFLADQAETTSEAAIFRGILRDTFVTVQDRPAGPPLVAISWKAGINWIWAGAILMSLGGFLAMVPRRRGAP